MQPPPPPPTFTTIDAPGAGSTSPEGTFGFGVNSKGDIAAYFIDSNHVVHGFIRNSSGTITTVDAPGAGTAQNLGTEVVGINASGETVGFIFDAQDTEHSYVRSSGGTFTSFDPPGAIGSVALCINDGGSVAGGFIDVGGAHGFVRAPGGTFTTIDPTGDATQVRLVSPNQINANGVITGFYFDTNTVSHAFVRDANGTVTVFDAPGAGTASGLGTQARDVNRNGVIVGSFATGVSGMIAVEHSFVRNSDGTFTVFDPPTAGSDGSAAFRINDSGAIVGVSIDGNLIERGYLRNTDGTFIDLDDPSAAQLPFSFTNLDTVPRGINASGAIVGLFSDPAGIRHAFIWQ